MLVSYYFYARKCKIRFFELAKGIDSESLLDELRKSIMPWVPAPIKSEAVSQEFFDTGVFDSPIILPEREKDPVKDHLVRKELKSDTTKV